MTAHGCGFQFSEYASERCASTPPNVLSVMSIVLQTAAVAFSTFSRSLTRTEGYTALDPQKSARTAEGASRRP
jgi:hypothetical protein